MNIIPALGLTEVIPAFSAVTVSAKPKEFVECRASNPVPQPKPLTSDLTVESEVSGRLESNPHPQS